MKKSIPAAQSIIVLIFFFFALSCGKNDGNGSSNNPPPATDAISIANMAYSPATLKVTSGTTVTWTNNDNMDHTVTADDSSFYSPTIPVGGKYSRTFTTAGTYPYHCVIHPGMKATVQTN